MEDGDMVRRVGGLEDELMDRLIVRWTDRQGGKAVRQAGRQAGS